MQLQNQRVDLMNVKTLQWGSFHSVLKVFTLFGFVGHLQLRRNHLTRQAMMHFSVVQVKCLFNTSSVCVGTQKYLSCSAAPLHAKKYLFIESLLLLVT